MSLDATTIQQFQSLAQLVRAANPLQQPAMVHDVSKWQDGLAPSSVASQALRAIIQTLGNSLTINRQDIFNAVKTGMDPQTRFLMQMIWGYAPRDARGPTRVLEYFVDKTIRDPEGYQPVITDIYSGRLKDAFAKLCKVSGLSTSYITKVLYFESRHLTAAANKKYSLILDDRVASGIAKITSPWVHACLATSAPRPFINKKAGPRSAQNQINAAWSKYWAYVEGCHEIARHLQTEADHLEMFLFDY